LWYFGYLIHRHVVAQRRPIEDCSIFPYLLSEKASI